MGHKCFISYKKEDVYYKNKLVQLFDERDVYDKSLDKVINSFDGEYIMKSIRANYLKDSTVTIYIIGEHSSEKEGTDYYGRDKNFFIKRELQASLYNGVGNTRNGILGVVLPNMYNRIYTGDYLCSVCGETHLGVNINDSTTVREFSENYYMKKQNGCSWAEDERYCVLVKWNDFVVNPEKYIEEAFAKRSTRLAEKVKVSIKRA